MTYSSSILDGYDLGVLRVFPVQYDAATGTLFYHRDIAVTVSAERDQAAIGVFRGLAADQERVAGLVENPAMLAGYAAAISASGEREAAPLSTNYQYVIITSSALQSSFQPLLNEKIARGLTGEIVTTEYIYANYTGTENNDNADKIRSFVRDTYLNHGTQWVLLGGDSEVIPARGVYASTSSETDTNLATDMYYACLDGPYNGNGNGIWGEWNDGAGGGGVDLTAEVYVGRVPASNATEAANFVAKTIQYETTAAPNVQKAVLIGEQLDSSTYGSGSGIAIRDATLPATWKAQVTELYDTSSSSFMLRRSSAP